MAPADWGPNPSRGGNTMATRHRAEDGGHVQGLQHDRFYSMRSCSGATPDKDFEHCERVGFASRFVATYGVALGFSHTWNTVPWFIAPDQNAKKIPGR